MTAISTSGHPALRRTRTGCPLDAKRCKWHVVGVRCAAPIGTNEIWRAIWLRWLDLGRGRSSGRRFDEVTARPAPQDRRRVRRLATFGTRALGLARSLSQLPKRATRMGWRGAMAVGRSLDLQPLNPLDFHISQIWRHRIHHGYHSNVAP